MTLTDVFWAFTKKPVAWNGLKRLALFFLLRYIGLFPYSVNAKHLFSTAIILLFHLNCTEMRNINLFKLTNTENDRKCKLVFYIYLNMAQASELIPQKIQDSHESNFWNRTDFICVYQFATLNKVLAEIITTSITGRTGGVNCCR